MEPNDIAGYSAGYLHDIGRLRWINASWKALVAGCRVSSGKWLTTPLSDIRSSAACNFPGHVLREIVRSHHERGDGSGYPDGLIMEDVAMPVRIIGLADTFDAMTSERPYRESLSVGSTLSEIVRLTPQKFDPSAVQGLLPQIRRDAVGSNRLPFSKTVPPSTSLPGTLTNGCNPAAIRSLMAACT